MIFIKQWTQYTRFNPFAKNKWLDSPTKYEGWFLFGIIPLLIIRK